MHISNADSFYNATLWQACEDYLHVGQQSYKIVTDKQGRASLVKESQTSCSFQIKTLLKIATYVTGLLPLLTWALRTYYRNRYDLKVNEAPAVPAGDFCPGETFGRFVKVTPNSGVKDPLSCPDESKFSRGPESISSARSSAGIADEALAFKQEYEKSYRAEEKYYGNYLRRIEQKYDTVDELGALQSTLADHLQDIKSYLAGQEQVVATLYLALVSLRQTEGFSESLDRAKEIYKQVSAFLRIYTPADQLPRYEKWIERKMTSEASYDAKVPNSYLCKTLAVHYKAGDPTPEENLRALGRQAADGYILQGHAASCFLLKHLRKTIKLSSKQDKIDSLLSEKGFSANSLYHQAKAHLGVTWLHGTKASALQSACKNNDGALLPVGKLKQQKETPHAGELDTSSPVPTLRKIALPGVNLSNASKAIDYANRGEVSPWVIKDNYADLFKLHFKHKGQIAQDNIKVRCYVDAVRLMKKLEPYTFKIDISRLKNKREEILRSIDELVFKPRLEQVYGPAKDKCFIGSLYDVLASMDDLEDLLDEQGNPAESPLDREDVKSAKTGVVAASSSVLGIPVELRVYTEESEEDYYHPARLGHEIRTLFTDENNIPTVQKLVDNKVKVVSFDVLRLAETMDKELSGYLYDIYSVKKWRAQAAEQNSA